MQRINNCAFACISVLSSQTLTKAGWCCIALRLLHIYVHTHKSCHAIWKHAKLILRGSRHRHRINHSLKGVFPLGNKYNCNINELISLMNSSRCINSTSAFFTLLTNYYVNATAAPYYGHCHGQKNSIFTWAEKEPWKVSNCRDMLVLIAHCRATAVRGKFFINFQAPRRRSLSSLA